MSDKNLLDLKLIQKCDDMMVDPNCVVDIYKILVDAEMQNKNNAVDTNSREQITKDIITQINKEISGYDFDGYQILFMYDCAQNHYQKKHVIDDSNNNISMNSLYSNDIRDYFKTYYNLESKYII